jgi:hypothetical protein
MRFLIVTVRMKRMMMLGRIASLIPKRRVGFHLCFRGNIPELDSFIVIYFIKFVYIIGFIQIYIKQLTV